MDLECIKYHEKMSADTAVCRHPKDYCKYRTSCIIHFLGLENRKKGRPAASVEKGPGTMEKDNND
jgi:hypothetical protein